MLRSIHDETGMQTHEYCQNYLGEGFHLKFYQLSAEKSCFHHVFIHLDDHTDKRFIFCSNVYNRSQLLSDAWEFIYSAHTPNG